MSTKKSEFKESDSVIIDIVNLIQLVGWYVIIAIIIFFALNDDFETKILVYILVKVLMYVQSLGFFDIIFGLLKLKRVNLFLSFFLLGVRNFYTLLVFPNL